VTFFNDRSIVNYKYALTLHFINLCLTFSYSCKMYCKYGSKMYSDQKGRAIA
jgi:hypothetical protein